MDLTTGIVQEDSPHPKRGYTGVSTATCDRDHVERIPLPAEAFAGNLKGMKLFASDPPGRERRDQMVCRVRDGQCDRQGVVDDVGGPRWNGNEILISPLTPYSPPVSETLSNAPGPNLFNLAQEHWLGHRGHAPSRKVKKGKLF